MAGLLAWAADVVGGGGHDEQAFPAVVVFTPEQQQYARELERKAAALRRSIQDLRLRLPPPDIAQRLPHLHAHSLASNAALALQLNSHSATRQQVRFMPNSPLSTINKQIGKTRPKSVQLREVTLQEENAAYEKAISNCQAKIQEKLQEADLLQQRLKEMDLTEKSLRDDLEKILAVMEVSQSNGDAKTRTEADKGNDASKIIMQEELDNKKKELATQREKILDKQLHSLIEQLASKQAQAERLVGEIHVNELELEKLNTVRRHLENGNVETSAARYRFGRSSSMLGSAEYIVETPGRPYAGGRNENQQKLMLMRSSFVLYILILHLLVFIKISF
ncbi:hypothetical protein ACLOJK_031138 [Asimina triloba]